MIIWLRLAELQMSRKRRFPIDESSEFNQEQQQSEPYCSTSEIDTENGENSGKELIKFERGVTNKGTVAIWYAGSIFR